MQAILKLYSATDRTVWLADSFEGLPKPDGRYAQDSGASFHKFKESLGVSLEAGRPTLSATGCWRKTCNF